MQKRSMIIITLTLICFVLFPCNGYAGETARSETIQVQFSGGTRSVHAVWVDMKDPLYRAEAAMAKKQVGQVDAFSNIVSQYADSETEVVAVINGTFFNSNSDMQPAGTIQIQGRNAYIGNAGTAIGFAADNTISFAHLYTGISGSVNGIWEYPYNWSVWGMNQIYSQADANALFTPDYGKQVDSGNKTAVVVSSGRVVDIKKGLAPINADGYTLVFGADLYASRFKIGDSVDYTIQYHEIDYDHGGQKGDPIDWSDMRTTVGAGPMLLKGGNIVLNAEKEGFTDKKFSNRAQRSFIGETDNRILILGTVANVTLKELAEIMKAMNVHNGMNLDGGASSALYFDGRVITEPGRQLSNALVITKKKERPIRLQLNNRELFLDTDAYFENNTTMVPMRGIVEALGAEAGWDPATGTLWASRQGMKVEMWNNSDKVIVNGIERKLLAPVRVVKNRTHAPARFMTEIFGGEVSYDRENNMVVMKMEMLNAVDTFELAIQAYQKGNITEAVNLFSKVIEQDPTHAGAMLQLAKHYAAAGDNLQTKNWFEKYLEIQTTDYNAWNSLGWTYANLGDAPKAREVFAKLTREQPDVAAYWIALGDICTYYQIQDMDSAKKCYQQALQCNPTDSQMKSIQAKLDKLN